MGRRIGILLPGVPQLLGGRVPEGAFVLFVWMSLVTTSVARFDRISMVPGGGLDGWVALVTLVGGLALAWWWSWRDAGTMEENRGRPDRPSGVGNPGWEIFRSNRTAMFGLGVIVLLYLAMLITPFIAPFDAEFREAYQLGGDMSQRLASPSSLHPLGTDQYSQDVLSRILYGARISLTIGLLAVGVSVTIGTLLGAVAGYVGGIVDGIIMRVVDMVMAFPRLVILIAMVAFFPTTIFIVVLALAFTQWPFTTRIVRGEILALKEREFADAARALGFSGRRILFRHLLPNALGPLIVVAMLGIGNAIILEAGLSFLGLGVQSGIPSWGSMVSDGRDYLTDAWWIATFPGLAIVLTVMAFNLVGDGLRDALDPRFREGGQR